MPYLVQILLFVLPCFRQGTTLRCAIRHPGLSVAQTLGTTEPSTSLPVLSSESTSPIFIRRCGLGSWLSVAKINRGGKIEKLLAI